MKNCNLISLCVHEAPEVLENQLENIQYCTNCDVVIFLDTKTGPMFHHLIKKYSSNPRILFNIGDHEVHWAFIEYFLAHVKNIKYASDRKSYSKVLFTASNSLFIKPGVDDWVEEYDCGGAMWVRGEKTEIAHDPYLENWWSWKFAEGTPNELMKLFFDKEYIYYRSDFEGSFYSIPKLLPIVNNVLTNIDYFWKWNKQRAWEEILFSSFYFNTYPDEWPVRLPKSFEFARIQNIRPDEIVGLSESFYSTKRIARNMNDPTRNYVSQFIETFNQK